MIKLVSVLPYFFMLAYGLFFLRKKFGTFVMGLFLFCVLSMPQMSAYTVEMRMYSLALLFVTAASFRWNGHFAALTLYGLAAAYTQYFACVAVVMVYGYLFLWFLVRRRRSGGQNEDAGKVLRNLVICVLISVLAYLPWLFVLVSQAAHLAESGRLCEISHKACFFT